MRGKDPPPLQASITRPDVEKGRKAQSSPLRLSFNFKADFDSSWLKAMRRKGAAELTTLPVVASRLGFDNHGNFTSRFCDAVYVQGSACLAQ